MTNRETTKIPRRQKCVDKEHPYIGGAVDVYDDDLLMTQAEINAIVLGGSINTSLNSDKTAIFVGEETAITLTAGISTPANVIKIKKGDTQIGSDGSGTSHSVQDTVTSDAVGTIGYTADFTVGGAMKHASRNVSVVQAIYYGGGDVYSDVYGDTSKRASARISPNGTYQIVLSAIKYIWFCIPSSMGAVKATFNGFDFPLDDPDTTSVSGYSIYRSSTPQEAGTYNIEISKI